MAPLARKRFRHALEYFCAHGKQQGLTPAVSWAISWPNTGSTGCAAKRTIVIHSYWGIGRHQLPQGSERWLKHDHLVRKLPITALDWASASFSQQCFTTTLGAQEVPKWPWLNHPGEGSWSYFFMTRSTHSDAGFIHPYFTILLFRVRKSLSHTGGRDPNAGPSHQPAAPSSWGFAWRPDAHYWMIVYEHSDYHG